jgi:hypothetical protein
MMIKLMPTARRECQALGGNDTASSLAETDWCLAARCKSLRGRAVLPCRCWLGLLAGLSNRHAVLRAYDIRFLQTKQFYIKLFFYNSEVLLLGGHLKTSQR